MNEKEIIDFISATKQDLKLAEDFLAMWRRRNGATAPSLTPAKDVQPPLIPEALRIGSIKDQMIDDFNAAMGASFNGYGANKKAILQAIEKCDPQYTIHDVVRKLVELGIGMSQASIQQGMSRLAKRGDIKVKTRAIGRRPTIYCK